MENNVTEAVLLAQMSHEFWIDIVKAGVASIGIVAFVWFTGTLFKHT